MDKLIAEFCALKDDAREEIFGMMEMKHAKYDDPGRVEKLKQIK